MNDVRFNKILIWINALVPIGFLGFDAARGQLGANPIEFFIRTTGVLTLLSVLITLSVTPLRKLTGNNQLIKYRRTLGLSASGTVADVIQRPFIALGMAAFLLMVPLAVTSTNGMIKRLGGRRWQRLHQLIYITGILGVIHFWMLVKSDVFYPALFGLVLSVLLGYRIYLRFTPKPVAGRSAA